MNSDLRYGFHLGDWLIEPLNGQVSSAAGVVTLSPQAMQLLLCLAENAGNTITADRLVERAWESGEGGPEALQAAVSDIRRALNDTAEPPEFLQSLPDGACRLLVDPGAPSTPRVSSPPTEKKPVHDDHGLFDSLRQRGVFQTAVAYLIFGWLIIQVVDVMFGQLHLPEWAGTFVTVLVIAGFPIAMVLSWFLEFREGRAVLDDLPPEAARKRHLSRTYISVVAGMALASVLVFIYDRNVGLPEPEPDKAAAATKDETALPPVLDNSIAVLPFFNMDGSGETQVFAQGLVDDVTTRLSRVPGLLVSSRGDAFTLEPNTASKKVRERLRVARYLEGSVQMQGDRMRIIVQLIDSDTGFHVLSRSFDRSRQDFFDVRDEITALMVANVRVALPPETQAASTISADDPSLDAYVLYRKGVDTSRLPKTMETLDTALSYFDSALGLDPDYSAAHAGTCYVFVDAYPISDDPAYIDRAEAACARALELNPNLDIVHRALGELYEATGRYDLAEAAYLDALEIDPKSVASLTGLGNIYTLQRKPDAAEERLTEAVGLHPGDWSAYNSLGYFLYRSGRYAEAAEQYEVVVALDNRNTVGYTNLGSAYMLAGDFQAAVRAFDRVNDIEPRQIAYSNLGLMYYYLGQFEQSVSAHSQAVKMAPNDYLSWSNLGDALNQFGKNEQARDAFGTAEQLASSALRVNPNDPYGLMDLAWIVTMLEKPEEAGKLIERARSLAPDDPYVHYINGLMLMRGGEPDAALSSLETAVELGYSIQMLAADPQLVSLRGHPDFDRITKKAETP